MRHEYIWRVINYYWSAKEIEEKAVAMARRCGGWCGNKYDGFVSMVVLDAYALKASDRGVVMKIRSIIF